jgi:hypothetical protein
MGKLFLVAVFAATPNVSDAKSEHYLLSQLNKPVVEEVIETAGESDRSKPVRTFLSNRIKNLKWHPVGNTVRRLKNKG